MAQEGAPGEDRMDNQRVLLLEVIKTEILNSLGIDGEPRPTQKATEEELTKMYQLYWAKLREMRENSSRTTNKTWQSTTSTVLFPATGEICSVLGSN